MYFIVDYDETGAGGYGSKICSVFSWFWIVVVIRNECWA